MRRFSLLFFCFAVSGLNALEANKSADPPLKKTPLTKAAVLGKPDKDVPATAKDEDSVRQEDEKSPRRDAPAVEVPVKQFTAKPLEDEMENRENIISQLLDDYDKVKAVSSGSDCVCRCVIRPTKHSDCSHIHNSDLESPPQAFYSVETITKGTDCKKCVCMVPPLYLNPCEREYRFKKLLEASNDDIKLVTIIDLLEDSLYGPDLLKLRSVTTKLLTKLDNMEKVQKNTQGQLEKNHQQDGFEQQQPTRSKPNKVKIEPKQPIKDKNSMVIRGFTFYQAGEESYKEEEEDKIEKRTSTTLTANAKVDFLISDHIPGTRTVSTKRRGHSNTSINSPPVSPINELSKAESQRGPKSQLSWTESPADQPKTTKKPALCKDTVANISEPDQQNSYGLIEGAWMKDARGHGNVIYLTNGFYDNNLFEFRDMDTFKSGQASNIYKLPYSFTGTGHVVFNGAFYYNRAFSRDVIRYDLRHRYVAAWTTLHDALLEEQAHRTQTEVEFAVDESGLWLLYPALDTEGFYLEVILLIHLRPQDLQPIRRFRTGLRRGRYGNSFLVCGVLYAVDSMQRRHANVTYAYDTHTLTHTTPSLAFTNMHGHTSQLAYCPLDKKLYGWDNGHQMMYDVFFAY
ncbi:olfactomedin-like protein 2B [Tautogolabrus adspersus]